MLKSGVRKLAKTPVGLNLLFQNQLKTFPKISKMRKLKSTGDKQKKNKQVTSQDKVYHAPKLNGIQKGKSVQELDKTKSRNI